MVAFISGAIFAVLVVALLLWRTLVIVNQASTAIIERSVVTSARWNRG